MRRPAPFKSVLPPGADWQSLAASLRDRLAVLLAIATFAGLAAIFLFANGTSFLMPGPLTSAHGSIETCSTCHSKSGSGKLSWVHGLVAGDPRADSKACLSCHKMPETAFNAHGASAEVLEKSTARLTKIAAELPQPQSARAQSIAFPTHDMAARGLTCATCHQEHQGVNFKLNRISNEQCRSCHVVKFDSFDGDHPKFDNYPFKRRTRIVYDHAGHFDKHFPEVAKKDPGKRIPETCSTCHDSRDDRRIMAVAPFDKTCTTCHLDQIVGKERASGPKGIAFLSLPGLDLDTLRKKKAPLGEWPDGSEAELTPFMKVMISRNEQGRALIKAVDGVNLQDLATASDGQIKAVTDLAWEIKRLFHALISGKASDVLADLNIVKGAKLSAPLVADLTASIPRDVVVGAQQQWLPNLAREIAGGPIASDPQPAVGQDQTNAKSEVNSDSDRSASPPEASAPEEGEAAEATGKEAAGGGAAVAKRDPPACLLRVFGQCLMAKDQAAGGTEPKGADTATTKPDAGKAPAAGVLPGAMRAGLADVAPPDGSEAPAAHRTIAKDKPGAGTARLAQATPPAKPAGQSDDLLFPTEEEVRAMKARTGGAGNGGSGRAETAPANPGESEAPAAPEITIASDVDPESWAEYGGWYRQDYAIFYRPTGHKDKFIYSWLFLTGPQAPKGNTSPAAAVFNFLTSKDAQGSCTKCHSVDDIQGKGRVVNFSPPSAESEAGTLHDVHP